MPKRLTEPSAARQATVPATDFGRRSTGLSVAWQNANRRVVTDKTALIGQYTAGNLMPGTLLAPGMTIAEPPAQLTFSTGKDLPVGLRAYPLTMTSDLTPVLREDDLVSSILAERQGMICPIAYSTGWPSASSRATRRGCCSGSSHRSARSRT